MRDFGYYESDEALQEPVNLHPVEVANLMFDLERYANHSAVATIGLILGEMYMQLAIAETMNVYQAPAEDWAGGFVL